MYHLVKPSLDCRCRPWPRRVDPADDTADKLGKLLPSEVTGLYVSLRALFTNTGLGADAGWYIAGAAVVALAIGYVYINRVRGVTNRLHLLVYGVVFVVWALTLDSGNLIPFLSAEFGPQVAWIKNVPVGQMVGALSIIVSAGVPLLIPSVNLASP